jgi:AcrR family transcriptional regulator
MKREDGGHDDQQCGRRGRGRPNRVTKDAIIAAARSLPSEELTMQAVADHLGVGRKSLYYHVNDRAALLKMVLVDRFQDRLRDVHLTSKHDWRSVLHDFAHALRETLAEAGTAGAYFELSGLDAPGALEAFEYVLQTMVNAGFDLQTAGRAATFACDIAITSARYITAEESTDSQPQSLEVLRVMQSMPASSTPALRQVIATRESERTTSGAFEFEFDVLVGWLAQQLASQ